MSVAATAEERLAVALDRGFGDLRAYPPGSHAGIVVLRIDHHLAPAAEQAVRELLRDADLDSLAGCIAVYRGGDLRVRRPTGT